MRPKKGTHDQLPRVMKTYIHPKKRKQKLHMNVHSNFTCNNPKQESDPDVHQGMNG